jgi:hypothetical protein
MVIIDTVYQRVLVLANKEQRGYITPQEFNLFANQAQMDIFDQYFYDINQFGRIPGNSTGGSDMLDYLEEKIGIFEEFKDVSINSAKEFHNVGASISDLYKIDSVTYNSKTCEQVNSNRLQDVINSPLLKPSNNRPVYVLKRGNKLYLHPTGLEEKIVVNYIRKPKKVEWSGVNISGSDLYDSTHSVNFELHPSEETKLVIKILGLAGITLKDPNLYQIAGAEDNKNIQQEKQ